MSYYQDRSCDYKYSGRKQEIASIPGQADDRKLFVGGLGRQTTVEDVRQYFSKFGNIDSVTVKTDPVTGRSRGFAFVVFSNSHAIHKLLDCEHYLNDRRIDPRPVTPKTKPGKIFVGGLTPDMSIGEIRKYFSYYGHILGIQAPMNKYTQARKPFCFVTFSDSYVVSRLIREPVHYIKGAEVEVREAKLNPVVWHTPGGRKPVKKTKIEYGPSFEYTVSCMKSMPGHNSEFDSLDDDVFTGVSSKESRRRARKKEAAYSSGVERSVSFKTQTTHHYLHYFHKVYRF